ncbi:MAG: hypothetical protein ABEI06_09730 [Halobacteriaceae archaeon]
MDWQQTIENIDLYKLLGPAFGGLILLATIRLITTLPTTVIGNEAKGMVISVGIGIFIVSVFLWPVLYIGYIFGRATIKNMAIE